MAATGEATQTLKYNTWALKVPIHCVGCKREVKKLLQNIEGVYSTTIDSQLQKVTVSGNIDSEMLLKKLMKAGKHAEIWNEKSVQKPKKNEKAQESKCSEKKEQITTAETKINTRNTNNDSESKNNTKEVKPEKKGKENNPASTAAAAATSSNAGNGGKPKKGKGLKGSASCNQANGAAANTGQLNVNPSRCTGPQLVTLSPTFDQFNMIQGPPAVHMMNYAAYPTKPGHSLAYQVPMSPSISFNTSEQMVSYQSQATAFSSFNIFSDENPNGCSIM